MKVKHIITTRDLSRKDIDFILSEAERFERYAKAEKNSLLDGKILANLFFEPSTRTILSFEAAMKRLGGGVINLRSTEASSIAKGETLADTIRVISNYCDIIALRHPQEGAARMAASFSSVPIINAGDGAGHHPTQTLLDLYTIKKESELENLRIAIVGDLRYGRTVHSLVYALALYNAKISLVSPSSLKIPEGIVNDLLDRSIDVSETSDLEEIIGDVDVLYLTRIQKERFPDPSEYKKVAGSYRITMDLLDDCRDKLIIMHPLPRIDEIEPEVDKSKHAVYFKQSFYGLVIRMTLLNLLLS